MDTKTDLPDGDPDRDRYDAEVYVLYVAFRADAPMSAPSRHTLRDVAVVEFGRGSRGATRGLRRLEIRVPDPLMSTQHGQLVRTSTGWVMEAPAAKNEILVRGERRPSAPIAPGHSWVLGHTVFLLALEPASQHDAADLDGSALAAPLPELATFDAALAAALGRMALVAKRDFPVLLLGPTGTGKEVTARALHKMSGRSGEFVAVNCGGLDPPVFASEMFGHQKGAFTGATRDTHGYVRTSDRGTLFLDEIGDLPSEIQTKLLRVLQEREVNPVGLAMPIPVDLRLCAATNRDLPALVAAGQFREDLYARLLGVTITLPPLRARRADLGLLIPELLRRLPGGPQVRLTPSVAARLFEYDWPMNIRQLASALALMSAYAGPRPIGSEHLVEYLRESAPPGSAPVARVGGVRPRARPSSPITQQDVERKQELGLLMRETGGNVAEVARRLGKDRKQIYRWLRRFDLESDALDQDEASEEEPGDDSDWT